MKKKIRAKKSVSPALITFRLRPDEFDALHTVLVGEANKVKDWRKNKHLRKALDAFDIDENATVD